eukprot:gene12708-8670_t
MVLIFTVESNNLFKKILSNFIFNIFIYRLLFLVITKQFYSNNINNIKLYEKNFINIFDLLNYLNIYTNNFSYSTDKFIFVEVITNILYLFIDFTLPLLIFIDCLFMLNTLNTFFIYNIIILRLFYFHIFVFFFTIFNIFDNFGNFLKNLDIYF